MKHIDTVIDEMVRVIPSTEIDLIKDLGDYKTNVILKLLPNQDGNWIFWRAVSNILDRYIKNIEAPWKTEVETIFNEGSN